MIKQFLCIMFAATLTTFADQNLQQRLAAAKPGQTVTLPAGEFRGGVTIPPGVSLKGAGVGKTIIDATGARNGLSVEGGTGAQISDLTVRNAQGVGVTIQGAESITVARVRATGGASGFLFGKVKNGRLENCISDHNSFGVAINDSADCAMVNCTVANCLEMGVSFAACPRLVVFNNCVVGSTTCLNIDEPASVQIDHNLYYGISLGQMQGQGSKRILTAWQYVSGLDRHSVQMPAVEFKNEAAGDFTPVSVLPWALDRAVTADWGVTEFAGVKAPATDMLGQPRIGRPDLGAIETDIKPPRTADGQFTVASDVGTKSAGVFTKAGVLISYLFQDLPLPKGKYSFWLPVRDYVGKPIPAGDYEVRLAESDFHWKYLNHVADNGGDRPMSASASFNPGSVAFAPGGVLVMQEGPSEDATGVRGYDALTGKQMWCMLGTPLAQGIAVGKDGIIYVMGLSNPAKGESRLDRLDSATGKVIPWPGSKGGHMFPVTSARAFSLTVLQDRLYVADDEAGKVFVITTAEGKLEKTLDIPGARLLAGDEKTKVLWVVSGNSVVAVTPEGTKVAESSAVPEPVGLAARDGQLAVASAATGKIFFFDANDPKNLKPLRQVGRGDGPYGAFAADRFFFQKPVGKQLPKENLAARYETHLGQAGLALGPDGQFAVAERWRMSMFNGADKNLWYTIGVFGNQSKPSFSTQNRRFWNTDGELSFLLNEKDGTWQPEGLWDLSLCIPDGDKGRPCQVLGDFADGGKTFLVVASAVCGAPFGPPAGQCETPVLTVARLDGFKAVPVMTVTFEGGAYLRNKDTNGDGKVSREDAGQPMTDATGQPLTANLIFRFTYLMPDGSILTMGGEPMIWKRTGVDAQGVPVYDGKNYVALLDKDWRKELSPYDLKPDYLAGSGGGWVAGGKLSDGGWVFQNYVRGSGGCGMNNGGGTDMAGYGPDGRRRWVHQLAEYKGIAGQGTVDDITLTTVFYSCETLPMDADGLSLGGFCEPPQTHYAGYWIDHPNMRTFKMSDGHMYATWGDNSSGRHPWFRLENQESLKRTKQPFQLAAARATELAALESKPAPKAAGLPAPKFRVPHLTQPFTIDGDLEKWRKAGIQPQIVIGPNGGFNGPGDNSAIIRMAYEGQNLYFQVLQFDDIPVFYQLVQGQCVELAINGACDGGMQFVAYKNAEGKDIVWRNRFFSKVPQIEFDPAHVPRIIKLLPDAQAVTERAMLEALYGVDLSKAKVIVTEFRLPLDKVTYAQAEDVIPQLGSGKTFRIGFFVDDNDTPYTDAQKLILWPATFNMFGTTEDSAQATCE